MTSKRFGIIDIGSNSIRLVIYEQTENGAYRVIDESKASARLSGHIDADGRLPHSGIQLIIETLAYFKMLCEASRAYSIRAVATAAVRNAGNSGEIVQAVEEASGIKVEILSGHEEARYGYLGVRNTLDIAEGFIVDIGGGSTEISYFKDRHLLHSVSFPFGSVNTAKQFLKNGNLDEEDLSKIRSMAIKAMEGEPWIRKAPGLPLIGLGGTIRSVSKIDQKAKKYSLGLTHNYQMAAQDVTQWLQSLRAMPLDKRRKVQGLAKERADIIVPGLVIMQAVFQHTAASHYVISGSGLRDGLFFQTVRPERPEADEVLEASVRNLMALHPAMPHAHVEQVNRLSLTLFDALQSRFGLSRRARSYVHTASLLYRIGVTIHYYQYAKHTFYVMAHSRIDGLSHREILICAMIASYKTKSRTRALYSEHKDILAESDLDLIVKLGTLLQLAIAFDRSETQPVTRLDAVLAEHTLSLTLYAGHDAAIEWKEAEAVGKEFTKQWGLSLTADLRMEP
ncbi:Ppx/GppA phosphatase family protein [Paenibacillus gansuensis]|uniref:Ppx/GppA family phosphatase n=1 Tax=Paenibacillus gansuensis TaxID=306542 RepID=A0ABW5PGK7_9BACL